MTSRALKKLNKQMDKILRQEQTNNKNKKRFGNRALRKMFNNKLSVAGLVVFCIILFLCIGSPLFAPYDPLQIDLKNCMAAPSFSHLLGTDKIGRDIFSRILYGGRISIFVGFGSALGTALLGVSLGTYAGYKGGRLDAFVFRLSELFMAFPPMILILLLVSVIGQNLANLIFIFIVTGWGSMYRMTRSRILSLREEEYVQAMKAFGLHDIVICFKHILPNAIGPIAVNITLSTAMFILREAALSFLGLGVPMEIPTWGNILNAANDISVLRQNWWIWLPVGSVIALFVLSINFIGDGLRDSADPSQQG